VKGAFAANSEMWLSFPTGDYFSAATIPACGVGRRIAASEGLKRRSDDCAAKQLERHLIGWFCYVLLFLV